MRKTNIQLGLINPKYDVHYEEPTEKKVSAYDYVSWGSNNTFPTYLFELYLSTSTHQSIIDGICQFVYGEGVTGINPDEIINTKGDTYETLLKRVIFDYILFGGFCLIKTKTRGGDKTFYQYLDIQKVRFNEEYTRCFYNSKGWTKYSNGAKNVTVYDVVSDASKDGVIYFRGSRTRGIYPICGYVSALKSLEIQREVDNFHLSSIKNNFTANMHISFINEDIEKLTDDDKEAVQESLEDAFSGSDNASKFMVSWVKSKDEAPVITRIEGDKADQKFQTLSKINTQNIFIAHRITSPNLFGLSSEGKGFSSAEYLEAFNIFNLTVINSYQTELEKFFKSRIGIEFKFNPFVYVNNSEKTEPTSDPITK